MATKGRPREWPVVACDFCESPIPFVRHSDKFCSKRCELESKESEYLTKLAEASYELKWHDKKNYIWEDYDKIIVVGDTHFPFCHPTKLEKAIQHIQSCKLTSKSFIIQIGDLYDFYSQTRFARNHCIYTPDQELKLGTQMADSFWAKINKVHPDVKKIQIKGNHDMRPVKRLLEQCPELAPFFQDKPLFEFEGVETVHESDQEVLIKDIVFQHGYTKHGAHMAANLMNTAHGHTHRGGTWFMNLRGKVIWELDAGYLGDPESTPLKYRERRWNTWTHGIGEIEANVPRFIPL
jgi:hypothetical protein